MPQRIPEGDGCGQGARGAVLGVIGLVFPPSRRVHLVGDVVGDEALADPDAGGAVGRGHAEAAAVKAEAGVPGAALHLLRHDEVAAALDTLPGSKNEGPEGTVTLVPAQVQQGADGQEVVAEDGLAGSAEAVRGTLAEAL